MSTYYVEFKFPKASRMPVYGTEVEATTRGEAELKARALAQSDGFSAAPVKTVINLVSKEAA
jgi:hypothetical protein